MLIRSRRPKTPVEPEIDEMRYRRAPVRPPPLPAGRDMIPSPTTGPQSRHTSGPHVYLTPDTNGSYVTPNRTDVPENDDYLTIVPSRYSSNGGTNNDAYLYPSSSTTTNDDDYVYPDNDRNDRNSYLQPAEYQ